MMATVFASVLPLTLLGIILGLIKWQGARLLFNPAGLFFAKESHSVPAFMLPALRHYRE